MRGEGVEVSLNFFPVSRKSDFFFMRLPVGSVVFVSHRRKRVVFRVCKRLAFRGMCQLEKDIKNAGSRWTARKVEECTSLGYSLLGGISLPKSLPIRFCHGYR